MERHGVEALGLLGLRDDSDFGFRPSIGVVKAEGEMVVTVELAGVDPMDADVTLDGNDLPGRQE